MPDSFSEVQTNGSGRWLSVVNYPNEQWQKCTAAMETITNYFMYVNFITTRNISCRWIFVDVQGIISFYRKFL